MVTSTGLYAQTIFSFDQLLDTDGLLFDRSVGLNGIDEVRIFIGSISTTAPSGTDCPTTPSSDINLGRGRLLLIHDDRDGDRRATTIEGTFSGTLWNPKITAGQNISTKTIDSNLSTYFNQVGSIPGSTRWLEIFSLTAEELSCPTSGPTDNWSKQDTAACWTKIKTVMMEKRDKLYPDFDNEKFDRLIHPDDGVVYDTLNHLDELKEYLQLAFASKIHPLGYLISILGKSAVSLLQTYILFFCSFSV